MSDRRGLSSKRVQTSTATHSAGTTLKDAALKYARAGWAIFPCRGKQPLVPGGFHAASTLEEQIVAWWTKWPDANIGFVPSSAGFLVLDLDGPEGAQEAEENGWIAGETRVCTTGKGRHIYYATTEKFGNKKVSSHTDIRSNAGYVMLPPSIHPTTQQPYTWATQGKAAPLPHTLRDALDRPSALPAMSKKKSTNATADAVAGWDDAALVVGEGGRNDAVFRFASKVRRYEEDDAAVYQAVVAWNDTHCDPPLPPDEVQNIVASVCGRYEAESEEWEQEWEAVSTDAADHGFTKDESEPSEVPQRKKRTPNEIITDAMKLSKYRHTDLGLAQRLVHTFGKDLRYIGAWKAWCVWDGRRWKPDSTGEVARRAKAVIASLYGEAERLMNAGEDSLAGAVSKLARDSSNARVVNSIVTLASTELEVSAEPDTFDAAPYLFNVQNGTLDLKTGKLLPHRRADHLTYVAETMFDPDAKAPRWLQFLTEVFPNDPELVDYFQCAVGYAMTGEVSEQVLFFCHGGGENGKGVSFKALQRVFGEYAKVGNFKALLGDSPNGDNASPSLVRLRNARLVTAQEPKKGFIIDDGKLKEITGGDQLQGRQLYQEVVEFAPTFKLFLAANSLPEVKEQSHAFWRRMRMIPFLADFKTSEKRDPHLAEKLYLEAPGILNWALEGCLKWQKTGLRTPKSVEHATQEYRGVMNPLQDFIAGWCEQTPGAKAPTTMLYNAYVAWGKAIYGPQYQPEFKVKKFSSYLADLASTAGWRKSMNGAGIMVWTGVGLKSPEECAQVVEDLRGKEPHSQVAQQALEVDDVEIEEDEF